MDTLQLAENFVFQEFKEKLPLDYTYHNFIHTQDVIQRARTIAQYEDLPIEIVENLLFAATFHDVGMVADFEHHEEKSAEMAEKFLQSLSFDTGRILEIKSLILATKKEYTPQNNLEAIIKDADTFHVGTSGFSKSTELLKIELKLVHHLEFNDLEWHLKNRDFLINHHRFYSKYGKEVLQVVKDKNIIDLQLDIRDLEVLGDNYSKLELKRKKSEKLEKPERGIDTMFRVTLSNHTRLSDIADSKANILLSVNAIIISIALSTLIPKLSSPKNEFLIFPTFIILLFNVVSIVFSILSTKPNVTKLHFTNEDIKLKKVNLLFFGNFYRMGYEQYEEAMNELMNDKVYLYNSLIRDLYYLGKVLNRKYYLLNITYIIFMTGIICSVLAFMIAFLLEMN